jgi:hypothetical protein
MKTLITTFAIILFTGSLLAQNYVAVNNNVIDTEFKKLPSKSVSKATSVSSFTTEIYGIASFQYRIFLKDAEDSKKYYQIGTEIYTKKELSKVFRKGAKRSENVIEFENYLTDINPIFLKDISKRETADIFTKFREGTLHAYLDSLPSGIF